jgi:Flp pilus assembly protein TadG
MVEIALSSMIVLLSVFGIMECCRAMYYEHAVYDAARSAARYAIVRGSSWSGVPCASTISASCEASSANISAYAQANISPGLTPASVAVISTWPGRSATGAACDTTNGVNSPGCVVSVQISYPFRFLLPMPSVATIQLKSSATVTVSQ